MVYWLGCSRPTTVVFLVSGLGLIFSILQWTILLTIFVSKLRSLRVYESFGKHYLLYFVQSLAKSSLVTRPLVFFWGRVTRESLKAVQDWFEQLTYQLFFVVFLFSSPNKNRVKGPLAASKYTYLSICKSQIKLDPSQAIKYPS